MYTLGTALTALSLWLALRVLRRDARGWPWWGFGASCAALTYTHHYGTFTVAAEFALVYGVGMWRLGVGEWGEARRLLGRLAVVVLGVGICYLPGLAMLSGQVAHVRRGYWIGPMSLHSLAVAFTEFALPLPRRDAPDLFGKLVLGGFAASCLVVARRGRVGDAAVLVAALGPMVLAAAVSQVTPIWEPRYFRFAHLAMLTTVVLAVWRAGRYAPWARKIVLPGVLAALLAADVAFWRAMELDAKPGPRRVAELILDGYQDGELVLVMGHFQYTPLKYYLGRRCRVRLFHPIIDQEWSGHLIRPADLIEPDALAEERRGLWLVTTAPSTPWLDLAEGMVAVESHRVPFYHVLHENLYLTHYRPSEDHEPRAERGREER
jgi:mannosyltransferase